MGVGVGDGFSMDVYRGGDASGEPRGSGGVYSGTFSLVGIVE